MNSRYILSNSSTWSIVWRTRRLFSSCREAKPVLSLGKPMFRLSRANTWNKFFGTHHILHSIRSWSWQSFLLFIKRLITIVWTFARFLWTCPYCVSNCFFSKVFMRLISTGTRSAFFRKVSLMNQIMNKFILALFTTLAKCVPTCIGYCAMLCLKMCLNRVVTGPWARFYKAIRWVHVGKPAVTTAKTMFLFPLTCEYCIIKVGKLIVSWWTDVFCVMWQCRKTRWLWKGHWMFGHW
jgi:hypothetical protein